MSNRPKNFKKGKHPSPAAIKQAEKTMTAGMLYKSGCTPDEYAAIYDEFSHAEACGANIDMPTLFEMLSEMMGEDMSSVFAKENKDLLRALDESEELFENDNPKFVMGKKAQVPKPAEGFNNKTLTLRIQLDGMKKPPLYREVKVAGNIRFSTLHSIIQIAMGWENDHLHDFTTKDGKKIGIPYDDNFDTLDYNEDDLFISTYLNSVGSKIYYEYDFGDGWEHTISVVDIEDGAIAHPQVIKSKGGKVVEDCGGIWGLQTLRDIVASKGRLTSDDKDRLEWMGCDNRAQLAAMVTAEPNLDEINKRLANI